MPDLVELIVDRFDPVRVIVFGSVGAGTDLPDSDIDLLVVLDDAPAERRRALLVELRKASVSWSGQSAPCSRMGSSRMSDDVQPDGLSAPSNSVGSSLLRRTSPPHSSFSRVVTSRFCAAAEVVD
jgi:Nucleotidyltransferase domain